MIRLKELREEKNLTQAEISRLLNIPRNSYYQWENEINQMSYETLYKFANFFNVSIDYLLGRSDDFGNTYNAEQDPLSQEEIRLIEAVKKLPENLKPHAIGLIEALAKVPAKNNVVNIHKK